MIETHTTEELQSRPLSAVAGLARDLRNAAEHLSDAEARFLVDTYYIMQEQRIRNAAQVRSIGDGEPCDVLQHFFSQFGSLESQCKGALDRYTRGHVCGGWMREVKGVGPVISAGLLAHIDITRCPTAGHIHSFAGLDPKRVWYGAGINDVIKGIRAASSNDWEAFIALAQYTNTRPSTILHKAELIEGLPEPDEAVAFLQDKLGIAVKPKAQFYADNIIMELVPRDQLADTYRELYPDVKINWTAAAKVFKKRPWNAQLKTLCYKIGESFVKTSGGKKPSHYGIIYAERKQQEIAKNEAQEFAKQASQELKKKNYSAKTIARDCYDQGMLPPAQIHARARRYAVKRFLSDLHCVWFYIHNGEPPVQPYAIAHGGHAHPIFPPHLDVVPGLQEALEKAWRVSQRS